MNPDLEWLSSVDTLLWFGIASGVLSTFAFIPYIVDTITGRTQPQRASWLIWSVLGSIALCSQIYEGASSSLWFAVVQVSGTVIVFALSIRGGSGRFLSRSDYRILGFAAAGLALWYFTETAAYALAITISISLAGGVATALKAYRDPASETLSTWMVALVAACCALFSVGELDPILLAYPLYLFTLYLVFVLAILMGRARLRAAVEMRHVPGKFLLRGLRTAADVVIVSAGAFYLVNWVNAGEHDRALSNAGAVRDSRPAGIMAAARELEPGLLELQALRLKPTIGVSVRNGVEFQRLVGRDLAIASAGIVQQQGSQFAAVVPSRREGFIQAVYGLGDANNRVPPGAYQALDAGDPFALMIVVAKKARLLPGDQLSNASAHEVFAGDRLLALAANGDWFRVRDVEGRIGYMQRSKLSVEIYPGQSRSMLN